MQHTVQSLVVVVVLIVIQTSVVLSAGYNELCASNADCIVANTTCQKESSPTCQQGKCLCDPKFEWDTKCKLKKFYLDPCNDDYTKCQEGSMCSQGQCMCSGGTPFNEHLRMCTLLKAVGENCTADADCYMTEANAVECVVPTGGSQTQCACKTGFKQEKGSCRLPRYGETCESTPGCSSLFSASDASLLTETCGTLSTCTCPSTTSTERFLRNGKIYNVCLETPIGSANVLDTCTKSNECLSKICISCAEFPSSGGNQEKRCVAQPTTI